MLRALDDLSSDFKPLAMELLARLVERGVAVMVVDTLRTEAEQAAHLANGTSWTMASKHLPRVLRGWPVTDVNAQKSDAIDVCLYDVYQLHGADKLQWDTTDPAWQVIGAVGEGLGLRWGGRFGPPAKPDLGHLELVIHPGARPIPAGRVA